MLNWIESDGGPLICLAKSNISSWGGGDYLTTESLSGNRYKNDYERACGVDCYLGRIALTTGEGIVLGDEPMMTSVSPRPSAGIQIVRIVYCSSVEDIETFVCDERDNSHMEELSSLRLCNLEAEWCMFDAASPGYLADESRLMFRMPVGDIQIKTFVYKPNETNYLIVHDIANFIG